MEFEIDVSGEDLLSPNYTICIADKSSIVKGFKFSSDLIQDINLRHNQGFYRYIKSKKGRVQLKIRIYCIVLYHLFNQVITSKPIRLTICRDFDSREDDIKNNLLFFLRKSGLSVDKLIFRRLDPDSNAHRYAGLMRKDTKNKMNTYVKISLEDIELFLRK